MNYLRTFLGPANCFKVTSLLLVTATFSTQRVQAEEVVNSSADAVDAAIPVPPVPVSHWKHNASGLFNLSQSYYDNWAKGGINALNWEIRLEAASVLDQEKYRWENKAKTTYGQATLGDFSPRKSSDELNLESIITYKFGIYVNPFASAQLLTQYAPGFKYDDQARTRIRVSGPFDPTFLIQTLGIGNELIKDWTNRLGFATKETFSKAAYGYADDKETTTEIETFKIEPGLSFNSTYKHEVFENINLSTMFETFVNFKGISKIDARWENIITAKVNKFVNVNFGFDAVYDKDLSDDSQYRESLAIGVSFLNL